MYIQYIRRRRPDLGEGGAGEKSRPGKRRRRERRGAEEGQREAQGRKVHSNQSSSFSRASKQKKKADQREGERGRDSAVQSLCISLAFCVSLPPSLSPDHTCRLSFAHPPVQCSSSLVLLLPEQSM